MNATILFDFDGVIADSIEVFSAAVGLSARSFGKHIDVQPNDLRQIKTMSIPEICEVVQIELSESEQFIARLDEELFLVADSIPLFAGMKTALKELSLHGHLGVVSASPRRVLRRILDHHDIRTCFQDIVGGDLPGTKAEKIESIRKRNRHDREAVCFIGDTVSDIQQGQAADVTTIAVGWGWHSIEWLRTAKPDFEVHEPSGLVNLILNEVFAKHSLVSHDVTAR